MCLLCGLQEVELMLKNQGISNPALTSSNNQLMSDVLNQQQQGLEFIKTEPMGGLSPQIAGVVEEMMDDSPMAGDPMMSASDDADTDLSNV